MRGRPGDREGPPVPVASTPIRMRDDVLSVVAHDLRNPLGTILLQAGLLRRGDRDGNAARDARPRSSSAPPRA